MRTYGKFEPLYTEARDPGSVFLKFDNDEPPTIATGPDGRLTVTVRDLLTERTELAIPVDLVVLVTGMVPRENQQLVDVLKLPTVPTDSSTRSTPKLRPVETVVDGVLIAGASQGPKTSSESVIQALAAVTQSAAVLKKGFTELDPLVAIVEPDACTACGDCLTACPYDAISMAEEGDRHFAAIGPTTCKGCGGCVPICPENAIDLLGYTDAEVTDDDRRSLAEVPV